MNLSQQNIIKQQKHFFFTYDWALNTLNSTPCTLGREFFLTYDDFFH